MTNLTAIFGSSQEEDTGKSEKLLELYWNRAELKKEFANLRDETFQLKDQLKTQQGIAARTQQKIDHLENLLLDSGWVHSVMVFYQLRALNDLCKTQVAGFAEQLKQQREKREHSRLVEEWDGKRRDETRAINERIHDLRTQLQLLENRLQSQRHRFSMMNRFMRFFRKRSIARTLDDIAGDIASAQRKEHALIEALTHTSSRQAPDTQGLSMQSKRSINFMILSFAQQLYLHFSDDGLAGLVKESGDKSVGSVNYGDKTDCEFLLEIILELGESMQVADSFADKLQIRAKLLCENAEFSSNENAVPESSSVATLYDIRECGVVRKKDVNLLGENYWDLRKILSR